MESVAKVILSEGLRSFDKLYDYIVPCNISGAGCGMRVLVPFGAKNKLYSGWIIDIRTEEPKQALKEINSIVDEYPLLNGEMLKLSEWMKNRYLCTWGDTIRCMIPAGVNLTRQKAVKATESREEPETVDISLLKRIRETGGRGILLQELKKEGSTDLDLEIKNLAKTGLIEVYDFFEQRVNEKTRKAAFPILEKTEYDELFQSGKVKSIYQARVMDFLFDEGICIIQDLLLISGVTKSTIDSMHKKGWIGYDEVEVDRNPFSTEELGVHDRPPVPTESQSRVLREIIPLLSENRLNEVLLHGITGSGKTEVYLRVIEEAIRLGKTAIVLVPEISLTHQMTSRFTGRFGERVAIQHSRLSPGERYDQWRKIRQGEIDVVIGVRSAVFAPLSNLGAIIVDEEHELTYKSENTPKYDARHVARARCNINGALLLLGSATPSLETYFRAKTGRIRLCELDKRANAALLPNVVTVDMRTELEQGSRSIISSQLEEALIKMKGRKEQAIIFLNRRGYASFLLCRDCGFVLKCPNCSVSLTYHSNEKQAICHYCGYMIPVPKICPSCKNNHIKNMGAGTQRIEEELNNHPAGFKVLRMDMDTTGTKYGHKKILDAFGRGEADILIGTQMVAKGHDFPNVTLVGILAADAMLYSGDFRASERAFQLITQASGRAGRGSLPGMVVLQTYNIDNYAVKTAIAQDYKAFYETEIMLRNQLFNPPFSHIGCIFVSGVIMHDVEAVVEKIYHDLADHYGDDEEIVVSKPLKAPIFIIRGRLRWRIIIKHPSVNRLLDILKEVLRLSDRMKLRDTMVSVDIDPADML